MGEPTSRDGLLALERDRWSQLQKLLGRVPATRANEPSLNPDGWSVRDLVWHVARWNDVVKEQLDLMHVGAFDDAFDWNTEENNARFLAEGRSVAFADAIASLERSRASTIDAVKQLDHVASRAVELFSEAAYKHIDDHVPELQRFLEQGTDA